MDDNGESEDNRGFAGGGDAPDESEGEGEGEEEGEGGSEENTDTDDEEEQFDITLAASHSYMGAGLVAVTGRCVREAGWRGRVPCVAHSGAVFPGETVPMLLPDAHDAALLAAAIHHDKLFGLLCPDESGTMVSGYGVLCEVFEASGEDAGGGGGGGGLVVGAAPAGAGAGGGVLTFKARANHRFRFHDMPKQSMPVHMYARMRFVEVVVLPEVHLGDPLRHARLASLDKHRRSHSHQHQHRDHRETVERRVRGMDAAVTAWPLFLYDIFDYRRMRRLITEHFHSIMLDKLPEEPVSLSFWVASNLALSARDRLALFIVDDALLRLHMEVRLIARKSVLCCASCGSQIARRDHIFAMSSEGVHSNYTNLGGYMHDIVTVSRCNNTTLSGAASAEFSWFPGYTWTVLLCHTCMAHIGWRFDAERRSLRPQQFYGLCRNYVQPRGDADTDGDADERDRTRPADTRAPPDPDPDDL